MPLEHWVEHWRAAKLLYDWQTLIAGIFAVGAAVGTILATVWSANREIKANKDQTATTVQLDRDRVAKEERAFYGMLEAAMARVLAEANWARTFYPQILRQDVGASVEAYVVRRCITKGAFPELRAACVRQGSHLTFEFLDLEREIDSFALQWEMGVTVQERTVRKGKHLGLIDQLTFIESVRRQMIRDLMPASGREALDHL
jgi:hypothetical protein